VWKEKDSYFYFTSQHTSNFDAVNDPMLRVKIVGYIAYYRNMWLCYNDARKTLVQWTGKVANVKVLGMFVGVTGRNDGN